MHVLFTTDLLDALFQFLASLVPSGTQLSDPLFVRALVAVQLACIICGGVGSLVVGNRMAFFSDALAHCAFAGIGIGLLVGSLGNLLHDDSVYLSWGIPAIMVTFGICTGLAIAFVRDNTTLASDTVIGVFFAGAIGFGAMILKAINTRSYLSPETFLFGDPLFVNTEDVEVLLLLALATAAILLWIHNRLVFASFSPSLARSRQISVRMCNYIFIVLLAVIVNLCLKTVGALLVNALLVVPAATASNVSRNLRQMFWASVAISMATGFIGPWASWEIRVPGLKQFGWSGTIVVVGVLFFFASMVIPRITRRIRQRIFPEISAAGANLPAA